MDTTWFFLIVFLASLIIILWRKNKEKDEVKAQFIGISILALIFYSVCFLSGICTILNFIWRWIL